MLGIYTPEEMNQSMRINSAHHFPEDENKQASNYGMTRTAFWGQIGEGTYNPSLTKTRDSLLRYVNRLLSNPMSQRGNSGGILNLKELFVLYGFVTNTPVNVSFLLCQALGTNSRTAKTTLFFFGSVIARLY
jgi:hypothetical protein